MIGLNIFMVDFETKDQIRRSYEALFPLKSQFTSANIDGSEDFESDRDTLSELAELVDISKPITVTSHRPILGFLIVGLKKAALRMSRPLIKVVLRRQIDLNEYVFHSACAIMTLKERVKTLESELAALKREKGIE